MTPLNKNIIRSTGVSHRNRMLVTKIAIEGVYTKGAGEHWSSAYLVPWACVDDLGARLKARQNREEKKRKRKEKRGY